eukprot:90595-Pleurochrysis_carterae.AAC.2
MQLLPESAYCTTKNGSHAARYAWCLLADLIVKIGALDTLGYYSITIVYNASGVLRTLRAMGTLLPQSQTYSNNPTVGETARCGRMIAGSMRGARLCMYRAASATGSVSASESKAYELAHKTAADVTVHR